MRLSNFSLSYQEVMNTPLLPLIIVLNISPEDEQQGIMSLGDISQDAMRMGPAEEWK